MKRKQKILIGAIVISLVILLAIFKGGFYSVSNPNSIQCTSYSECPVGFQNCEGGFCISNVDECSLSGKMYVQDSRCANPTAGCCVDIYCTSNNDCSTWAGATCNQANHFCVIGCANGENVNYCSSIDNTKYFKCSKGVSYSWNCPYGMICGNGNCVLSCTPKICSQLGKTCGDWDNSCGTGNVHCGSCPSGQSCSNGNCIIPLGKTCSQLGLICGTHSDQAGGILNCGTCNSPLVCNAYGTACVQPCIPKSCSQLGKQCGNQNDGCGGLLQCGTCGSDFTNTCKNGVCIPTPYKCADCDAFALSTLTGSFWKSKSCEPTLLALPPQTYTFCWFSFLRYLLIPIVLIFSLLFGSDFLQRFGALRKNIWVLWLVNLIIAGILSYVVYISFWIGIIVFIIYVIIKMVIAQVNPLSLLKR